MKIHQKLGLLAGSLVLLVGCGGNATTTSNTSTDKTTTARPIPKITEARIPDFAAGTTAK